MAYWEYDKYDAICSDYLNAVPDKFPFLHIGAINTPPEDQSQYVFVETLHLETDAEYIELRTLDFGNHWPSKVWNKHQVVHCNRWGQPWRGPVHFQAGLNTEIVRSIMGTEEDKPSSEIFLRFPPQTDLLDFNCLLYPGQILLFIPNRTGCHLYFTFKLYKFSIPAKEALEKHKRDAISELKHVQSLLNPVEDIFKLLAKLDPELTSKKRKLITKDLGIIDTCVAELIELLA